MIISNLHIEQIPDTASPRMSMSFYGFSHPDLVLQHEPKGADRVMLKLPGLPEHGWSIFCAVLSDDGTEAVMLRQEVQTRPNHPDPDILVVGLPNITESTESSESSNFNLIAALLGMHLIQEALSDGYSPITSPDLMLSYEQSVAAPVLVRIFRKSHQ